MYHKKCMENYLRQYKIDVQILLDTDKDNDNDLSSDNDLEKGLFNDIMSSFELEKRGYTVTNIRNILNKKLQAEQSLSNQANQSLSSANKVLYTQGQNSYKIPSKEFVFSTTADCKPSRSPKMNSFKNIS